MILVVLWSVSDIKTHLELPMPTLTEYLMVLPRRRLKSAVWLKNLTQKAALTDIKTRHILEDTIEIQKERLNQLMKLYLFWIPFWAGEPISSEEGGLMTY